MDLTIIVPTRDRNVSVVDCVHALEHNKAEIIVVDDASDDPVVFPARRARVIRHERQRGRSASINTGLKAASNESVLIMHDDVYAAPDMVVRLVNEFAARKNPKLGLRTRVVWDPDVPLTLTMNWMENAHKFPSPMLLSKSFALEHGGYDENLTRDLEDNELELRLKEHGFEVCRMEAAVGFQHNSLKIRDLVQREFIEGVSAVFLQAKFPGFMPQLDDTSMLLKNEAHAADAESVVEEIALIEEAGSVDLSAGIADLYVRVCRHYFLRGVFEGLKDIGGTKPRRNSSSTLAIYKQASRLKDIGEVDEARRLFRLVLHRSDEEYWDEAEYHLGCIETVLGNAAAAHAHFHECLRRNPAHSKARRALDKPTFYREVESNVFERLDAGGSPNVLVVVFGDLGNVVNAIPVVAALGKKFGCEPTWLTSPECAGLARASWTGTVYEARSRGHIPWEWIHSQGFTHVFFPEPCANREECEQSGLHAIDFMAKKCGVTLEDSHPRLEPDSDALSEAEHFLKQHRLKRSGFITAACGGGEVRHWPNSNLMRLAEQIDLPTVVFGKKDSPEIPNTIPYVEESFEVIALLIEWSCFYLGPAHGISWLATMSHNPMAVFFDPQEYNPRLKGFRNVRRCETDEVQEWDIYTNVQTVIEHVESKILITSPR
jgi:glycosyltransferase involved in cell wall biosynthesis/ADP-heptose:LPS heptosyltransferase